MKTFTKYIIPSVLACGLLIAILVTVAKLDKLVNATTSDLILYDALNSAITFNVITVLVLLAVELYVINFIIFVYNKSKRKPELRDKLDNHLKGLFKSIKDKMESGRVDTNNKVETHAEPITFVKPLEIFNHLKALREFPNEKLYVAYLSQMFTKWSQACPYYTDEYKELITEWVNRFQSVKPKYVHYSDKNEYKSNHRYWQGQLPMVLLDQLNLDEEDDLTEVIDKIEGKI